MRTAHSGRHFRATILAAAAGLLALIPAALARPTIRQSFFNAYPSAVGTKLDNLPSHAGHCGVCHYDFNGGGARNPFGVRLGNVIGNYANTDAGRQQAIHFIENEDPEGDGYSALVEVTNLTFANTPTFPGLSAANVGSTLNVPTLSELTPYLTPTIGVDTQPPTVNVVSPDGGESWGGGTGRTITWTASDNVGVSSVSVYWRDAAAALWTPIVLGGANTGSAAWFVPNMPTAAARVLVVAYDAQGNAGRDSSAAGFTVTAITGGIAPTTLRDFDMPGTQPLQMGTLESSSTCISCHGGYDPANEPGRLFRGSMMAQAGRDPLFYACLAVADRDAPSAGDLCIRCHSMSGWLAGRSQPTTGSQLGAVDRDGVNCDLCHRLVDPIYQPGVSPAEDSAVLAGLLPAHTPVNYSNGQMVLDPQARRRGPFSDTVAPHQVLSSPFHRTGEFCGTCHDVSNPVFTRTGPSDYAPGPLDHSATSLLSTEVMPLERTYSEWKNSAYPAGVYAPQFAGNRPDGTVRICQDCHMPDAAAKGCNDPLAQVRQDLPRHDLTGGSSWMIGVVGTLYPGETDAAVLAEGSLRSRALLAKSATVDVAVVPEADSLRAQVTVTNLTGHKLPTGYPEGRRMWLHVVAWDGTGTPVFESGAWDPVTGVLAPDASLHTWEIHLGISPPLAAALGATAGPSFHFALNDSVYLDNRIPPLGFTNTAFATFGGSPVDPAWPGPAPRYADGQNWDVASYALPPEARRLTARLVYQSTSRDYVEFLRDANTTNGAGQAMYDAWVANGRAAPVEVARDSATFAPLAVEPAHAGPAWTVRGNPFHGALALELSLDRTAAVGWGVYDAQGRALATTAVRELGAGRHRFTWDGRDRAGHVAGAGVFWLKLTVDGTTETRRVVRLQ
jgi:hypothetical protein